MRHYELITVLSPILNQEESVEAWDRIKEFITNREAEIVREQNWGTRRLAYPIHKGAHHFLEGTYYLTPFQYGKAFQSRAGDLSAPGRAGPSLAGDRHRPSGS